MIGDDHLTVDVLAKELWRAHPVHFPAEGASPTMFSYLDDYYYDDGDGDGDGDGDYDNDGDGGDGDL